MTQPIGEGDDSSQRSQFDYQQYLEQMHDEQQKADSEKLGKAVETLKENMGTAREHDNMITVDNYDKMIDQLKDIQQNSESQEVKDKIAEAVNKIEGSSSSPQSGWVEVNVTIGDTVIQELEPKSSQ